MVFSDLGFVYHNLFALLYFATSYPSNTLSLLAGSQSQSFFLIESKRFLGLAVYEASYTGFFYHRLVIQLSGRLGIVC